MEALGQLLEHVAVHVVGGLIQAWLANVPLWIQIPIGIAGFAIASVNAISWVRAKLRERASKEVQST